MTISTLEKTPYQTKNIDLQETARTAILDSGYEEKKIGSYIGAFVIDEQTIECLFESKMDAYPGWNWSVVLANLADSNKFTISEVVMIPGENSFIAPAWIPWKDRIEKGDLQPGDIISTPIGDDRLAPTIEPLSEMDSELTSQSSLVATRTLSYLGRQEISDRWIKSTPGSSSTMSRHSEHSCVSCGFYIPLRGSLGTKFGVCANQISADAQVVNQNYGCGAHSETSVPSSVQVSKYYAFDDGLLETQA